MAIADVFDALISRRHYKRAFTLDDAVDIIRNRRGQHFDPDMVDAFLAIHEEFHAIAQRYIDTDNELEAKRQHLARLHNI